MSISSQIHVEKPTITESNALYQRAKGLIPSVTQTLAKGPTQHVDGFAPKFLRRGKGAHVWDVDGNRFLDYTMGVGPLSLGYADDRVDEAIQRQLKDGITFSLMHPLEVEVAELFRDMIPNCEAVRYSKSGADVASAAVRVSRAFTGRDVVLCCGYHGWHDWYVGVTSRNAGVPDATKQLTYTFQYNDIETIEQALDETVACVILEPTVFEAPQADFLQRLHEVCKRNGTLLIFDEMWTGFRMAPGGAQEYFGVTPDLAVYSKAMANGMPIAAITGRRDVMALFEEDVFFYTTFGGEALSLAAAKATMEIIRDEPVNEHMFAIGKAIKDGYNSLASQKGLTFTKCSGFDCRTIVTFDASVGDPLLVKSLVQQEMIRRGVLWSGFHNVSYAHTQAEVEHTLAIYDDVLDTLSHHIDNNTVADALEGSPLQPVFRKVDGFNIKPKQ